jgi:heat shock protein HslJ
MLLSACIAPIEPAATQPESEAAPAESAGPLSEAQLKNATYSGIYDEPVTLTDGIYEGEPFVEGGASRPIVTYVENSALNVDLNADSLGDGVVLLAENSGGSGVFTYAGAQLSQSGQAADAGTVLLGDRVQIISMAAMDNQVVIEMVTVGPDDAMCCATLKVRKSLGLDGNNMLAEVGSEELGTVSLDDLMNTEWVLAELDRGQAVAPEPPITAAFADGQVSGSAGCNSYSGSVSSEGGQTLSFGPLVSTMMACPDPIMDQELAYLGALQGAFQWSYQVGQLAITYRRADDSVGFMLFNPGAQAEVASADSTTIDVTYQCADDITLDVVYNNANGTVTVGLPDGTVELPRVEAASGEKYSDGTTTFWGKGSEAFVEINGEIVYRDCVAQE